MANITRGEELKPIYYIYGAEDLLIEEAVDGIKARCLTPGFETLNYHAFDAKGIDLGEVFRTADTMPAFSERRVILIRKADSLKPHDQKALADYAADPSPSACLILVAEAAKVNRSTTLVKTLEKLGCLVARPRLKDHELARWIKGEAAARGKDITEAAARKLISIAGTRLRDVRGELEKITLYAGDKPRVDVDDVEGAGLDCREETIFGLSDAIGAKDLSRAMEVFAKVSSEEPLKTLGAIARQMRVLLKLKSLAGRGSVPKTLAGKLGVPPWAIDGYVKQSRRFSERELKGAVRLLAEADTDLKTGRVPRDLVIPGLIIELCSGGGRAAGLTQG